MTKLICIGQQQLDEIFKPLFDSVVTIHTLGRLSEELTDDSLLAFGGGNDISPTLYGEFPSERTLATTKILGRDLFEASAFNVARERQLPMLGICRGSQLLCALSGGKLIQHLNGHGRDHHIITDKNEKYWATSTHHQAMWPFDIKHKMIAWADTPKSNVYVLNDDTILSKVPVEPEIVYFPTSKSLGIQGHPEYLMPNNDFVLYCHKLIKEYLL